MQNTNKRLQNIQRIDPTHSETSEDWLAVEEPLEIRITHGKPNMRNTRPISITMRTPGDDAALAIGFLWTEGLIDQPSQVQSIENSASESMKEENVVTVDLHPDVPLDFDRLQRHFFASSSCGVCGKATLDALKVRGLSPIKLDASNTVNSQLIYELPKRLRTQQALFKETGGVHAAGLFDFQGNSMSCFEDIGRHNAVDKCLGHAFQHDLSVCRASILVLSGRAGFEIIQKAVVAKVPVVVAVGAPSSLAVELAASFGLTLIGFTSADRFNIYTHPDRIKTH